MLGTFLNRGGIAQELVRVCGIVRLFVFIPAMASHQEDMLNLFPKSSGPPGPASSTAPYLTLTAGQGMNAASIQTHNEQMANRMLERIHETLPGHYRSRSRSPPIHPSPPLPRRRQAIIADTDEPESSAGLAVAQAGQRTFEYPTGPALPEPSRD